MNAHSTLRRAFPVILGAVWVFGSLSLAAGAAVPDGAVSEETARVLGRAFGLAEPSVLARVAASIPGEDLVAACYRGNRAERMIALSAAAHLEPEREVLSFLLALAGARQRETASRAVASLQSALERMESRPDADPELLPAQAMQLAGQGTTLALDMRLAPDIRLAGLTFAARISRLAGLAVSPPRELFDDPEVFIRGGAMSLLDVPMEPEHLAVVAAMASADDEPVLRGQAAGLLCENALAHRVPEPSADLNRLMRSVAEDEAVPPDGLAPLLGCLARFPPLVRAGLVERVLSRDVEELRELWKELAR